jgi:hypothetical protein
MQARIYKPAKSTMQSGRGKNEHWVLEYELETPRRPDALMGWISSGDTLNQVVMKFESREAAVAFAESQGMTYSLAEDKQRIVKPRSYTDNFKYRPAEDGAK